MMEVTNESPPEYVQTNAPGGTDVWLSKVCKKEWEINSASVSDRRQGCCIAASVTVWSAIVIPEKHLPDKSHISFGEVNVLPVLLTLQV